MSLMYRHIGIPITRRVTIYTIVGMRGQSGINIDSIRLYEHFEPDIQ